MADGDPSAVFRARFDPAPYRRRFGGAGQAPPPPATVYCYKRPQRPLEAREIDAAYLVNAHRRAALPSPLAILYPYKRPQPPLQDREPDLSYLVNSRRRAVLPTVPAPPGPYIRPRRVPDPEPQLPAAIRARMATRRQASFGNGPSITNQVSRLTVAAVYPDTLSVQVARLTVGLKQPPMATVQVARLVVGRYVPCVTQWQQLWILERRDGQVFRFTSLDRNFVWGGEEFKACSSLTQSAVQESSEIGQVGNIELSGILEDDAISEADLYGGLFDDAYIQVWLVPYQGIETPRRLAAGWCGDVSHGEQGFKAEVTGPGAKLDQQGLTRTIAPNCGWVFGGAECTKDLTALQTTGTVTGATNRGLFLSDAADPANGSQWGNSRVIWTGGRNAGITCESKSVDFGASGDTVVDLWQLCAFLPEVGDTFTLQPGCDLSPATCKGVYANYINFGGFPDVPGNDALAQTPDAKVT